MQLDTLNALTPRRSTWESDLEPILSWASTVYTSQSQKSTNVTASSTVRILCSLFPENINQQLLWEHVGQRYSF